ncbi:MAG: divalent metal cation transporter, partial [Planctomycetes bacterium]|nr:divalent metal cation transporter [Planctomycetota bacterium]
MASNRKKLLTVIGPGILVAATGVGAGDLATAAFSGIKLGPAILWAVIVGAGLKYVLNEGLTRWQLATGQTLLEGAVAHFGRLVLWLFLGYLIFWSFFVAAVLMSACGVTAHAFYPIFAEAANDKILYGIIHSALAILLIKLGGYRLFAKVMSVCIAVMFLMVLLTAIALTPSWSEVASGLVIPKIPEFAGDGLPWTVALLGGIGGTVTVMCYGYWIREEGRQSKEDLPTCRIDLAVGYGMTGLFGIAMVIIG